MKNRRNIIIVIVSSVLFTCLLLYLLFYVLIINNASYNYNKYYSSKAYTPNEIEQEFIVLLGEAGYNCEFSYPFEEGGQEEFESLSEDARIVCRMTKNEDINIDSDNMSRYDIKVEIDGLHYKVNNSISLSKINNIYQIDTFMSVASFSSDEYKYDDKVLKYVDSLRYAGKTDSQHLQEDRNLHISGATCDLDYEFLKSDKIVENVLLNKTELDENDFSAFVDYEKGRNDSIEESMEICEETIDMYGEQLYKDIVQPLKESRIEIIPKLLEIIGEK